MAAINIVLNRPPGPASDFVEIENDLGHSVTIGQWHEEPGGRWVLRITDADLANLD